MQNKRRSSSGLWLVLILLAIIGIFEPVTAGGEVCIYSVPVADFMDYCGNPYGIYGNYPYTGLKLAPATCNFVDSSHPVEDDTKIDLYEIDFGDNTPVVQQAVLPPAGAVHTYNQPGTYTVTWKIHYSGCSHKGEDKIVKTIEIQPPPPAPEINIESRMFVRSSTNDYSQKKVDVPIRVYLARTRFTDPEKEPQDARLLQTLTSMSSSGLQVDVYKADQFVDPNNNDKWDFIIIRPEIPARSGISPAGSNGWIVEDINAVVTNQNCKQEIKPDTVLTPSPEAVFSITDLIRCSGYHPKINIDWRLIPPTEPAPPGARQFGDLNTDNLLTADDVPIICPEFEVHIDQFPIHYHTTLWLKGANKSYQYVSMVLKQGIKGEYFPGTKPAGMTGPGGGMIVNPDIIGLEICPSKIPNGICIVKCAKDDCTDGRQIYEIRNEDPNKHLPLDFRNNYKLGVALANLTDLDIKNDAPPLKDQYLYIWPPDANDLVFIKTDGTKEDSAAIAKNSAHCFKALSADFLAGDCNRDLTINVVDIGEMNRIKGDPALFDTLCDMNGDRKINETDIDLLVKKIGKTPPAPTTSVPQLYTPLSGAIPAQPEPGGDAEAPPAIPETGRSSPSILDTIFSAPQAILAIITGSQQAGGTSQETAYVSGPGSDQADVASPVAGVTGRIIVLPDQDDRVDGSGNSDIRESPLVRIVQEPETVFITEIPRTVVTYETVTAEITTKPTVACPGTTCGAGCYDIMTDNMHCGDCNNACDTENGYQCLGGTCYRTCPSLRGFCGGKCVDLQTDNGNCGWCGNVCESREGFACINASCRKTSPQKTVPITVGVSSGRGR